MIVFNGVSSDTFSAKVFRIQTDNAPIEEMETFQIPGRNGDLLVSNHRFPNVEHRYKAVFYGDDAMQNYVDFKNYLLAQNGYQRLEDDDHPDEYYMARVSKEIEPTMVKERDKVKCEIVFERKPQRYIKTGETHYTWVSGDNSISGESLYVFADYLDQTERTIIPTREYITDANSTTGQKQFEPLSRIVAKLDGEVKFDYSPQNIFSASIDLIEGKMYVTSVYRSVRERIYFEDGGRDSAGKRIFKSTTAVLTPLVGLDAVGDIVSCSAWAVGEDATQGIEWVESDTSGYIYVHSGAVLEPPAFGYMVYNWTKGRIDFAFEESITYNVTNTWDEEVPIGFHTISVETTPKSSAEIQLKYSQLGAGINNPSPFPSKPLIRIYGNGTFAINDISVTVANTTTYTDVDCELMDCYTGGTNRNNDVVFSTYDFPELQTGNNDVTFENGITMVEIVPRWWRL